MNMKPTVINIQQAPRNWWQLPDEYVYIGRRRSMYGIVFDGYFGNPYAKGYECKRCGQVHADGGSTLPCFEAYARERMVEDEQYRTRIAALAGKRLVCWCAPNPCHGDVLATLCAELLETTS